MKISLNFQTLVCRCGGTRTLAAPCPECGAKAPLGEVDRFVVRRRQAVERVTALVAEELDQVTHPMKEPAPSLLTECLNSLLHAVSGFAREPTSEEHIRSLAEAIVRIRSSRSSIEAAASRRPGIGTRLAFVESLRRIEEVWSHYRDALSATEMAQAQDSADRAQRVIDSIAEPIAQAVEFEGIVHLLADETRPIPERMMNALQRRFPELPVLEMRRPAVKIAEDDLGVNVGPNSGLSFLLLDPIAATMFDPEKFRNKIRLTSAAVTDSGRVRAVAAMDGAVPSLAEAHRLMVEAAVAFVAVLNVERDDRAIARRLGRLVSEIYEAATPVFAWYRLLSSERSSPEAYSKTATEDATKLVVGLQEGILGAVFGDAAKYLRHAPVHGRSLDYEPTAHEFIISLKTHAEVVSQDEFMDRIQAFLETVLASIWSLENAMELEEIDISFSDADALYLGFTPLVLTAISLPAIDGLVVRDYGETGGEWYFRVEGDADLVIPALVAAQNAVGLADAVVVASTQEPPLVLRLADSNSFVQSRGRRDSALSLLALKASARLEGRSILKRTDVQFMLAGYGAEILGGDIQPIPHLRRLKSWSQERGWRAEAALADEIIAVARGVESADLRRRLAKMMGPLETPRMPKSRAVRVIVGNAEASGSV